MASNHPLGSLLRRFLKPLKMKISKTALKQAIEILNARSKIQKKNWLLKLIHQPKTNSNEYQLQSNKNFFRRL